MTRKYCVHIRESLLVAVVVLLPWNLYASSQVILIGGGPTPGESQASIELNTRWISEVILRHDPDRVMHMHFTDGNDAGLDVRSWSPVKGEAELVQPMARVFGSSYDNGVYYYSSHLADDVSPSDLNTVKDSLGTIFKALSGQDDVFLIYQGHGGWEANTNNNHFRLWGETRMTVTELEELMSEADPGATVRFLLPQCFSGAFSRLIYKDAKVANGLAAGNRCGFLAQREESESEGCTDSINTNDYRDYSSYFFSALDGRTIDGDPLARDPDRNADGVITLLEAHYYALETAMSVDYSRSTSQDYLENWQPWYLRWLTIPANPENVYSEIAGHIAESFGLQDKDDSIAAVISANMKALDDKLAKLKEEQQSLEKTVKQCQKDIQRTLVNHWPGIRAPYTNTFRELMQEEVTEILYVITEHERYQELVKNQDRKLEVDAELLDLRRQRVQMDKIQWMRDMARVLEKFRLFASDQEMSEYERIIKCEDAPL